jgi:hypothetical protein
MKSHFVESGGHEGLSELRSFVDVYGIPDTAALALRMLLISPTSIS